MTETLAAYLERVKDFRPVATALAHYTAELAALTAKQGA